jgi:3-hydroxyethyl bacteriochlorophyllide a dehydrogenase
MDTAAVVLDSPRRLALRRLELSSSEDSDVVVEIAWSGISTGTERMLWLGRMPEFPGMGYPLVPGYESVGVVSQAGPTSGRRVGEQVFVPGARCYGEVRGLFGGAAARVVVPGRRVVPIDPHIGEQGVLLALAATAYHAVAGDGEQAIAPPELIVGHGVLGRLIARLTVAAGYPPPTVWERAGLRAAGSHGYAVVRPEDDTRRDYRTIYEASGDASVLDTLMARLAPRGEIVLAGFYGERLSFDFAPAFMREAHIRAAAEWKRSELLAVKDLVESGQLSLDGLITHRADATQAADAYETAFGDAACLKMVLDWRAHA